MIFHAAFHPIIYLAVSAAIFSWLFWRFRRSRLLPWAIGWSVLLLRQLLVLATPAGGALRWIDAILLLVAAGAIVIGGLAYVGRPRLGLAGGVLLGVGFGALTAGVLVVVATARPESLRPWPVAAWSAAASALVAAWIGTGGLLAGFGRDPAPAGARFAGIALVVWGAAQPVGWIVAGPPVAAPWLLPLDAALGALLAVGMLLLGFEEARARIVGSRSSPRDILDDDPNMIVVLQDGRYRFANRALTERTGLSLGDFREEGLLERVAPEHRETAARMLALRLAGEPVPDYEVEVIDTEGRRIPVVVQGVSFEWEGRPAFKYELTDISPRRRAEEEIRAMNQELQRINRELERSNQLKTEFLSNTSHELKTPLTSIIANTEILEYEMCGPVNEEQREVLANIDRNSQNLLEMISRLLDFARHEEGHMGLRYEEVEFGSLLDAVLQTIRPMIEEEPLEITVDLDAELGPCWLDGEKINRVYLNLVENAIKFSDEGGIEVGARLVDGEIEGWVRDQGIGIPPESASEIFDPFQQVDASSTRSYQGVGLGLAICKQLVEFHGGRIWVESEPGEGSVFRFRLPHRIETPGSTAEPPSGP